MSVIARGTTKAVKIVYPSTCKEVTEELGKDELVRRLKLIARAFQDMGQDENEQYSGLALHLATDFFLEHSNKDVRLLVACCIADVFRIFAPEAPYRDTSHLKDIFMFLIKQLRGLEDPNSPTFKRYFYLLENLAWVKSFNICIDLDDNQEIFCSLFKLMFAIINEKHTGKVKGFMLDMMSPLLTEADIVSQELLDILLINIVEPHKTQNRQAFGLAKDLLIRTCNSIEPYVQAFFNNALMLGKTSESELSEHMYELIYELNTICPSVLLSVLPQLEFKLKSNEESERKAVTKVLARMFSDQGSNLAEQNKPLWNCFVGRFNDISITVRTVCVQSSVNFITHHPELVKDVLEQVKIRQHDSEETVRQEVVTSLVTIAKANFDIMTDEMLEVIKERTRDKKFKIRRDALMGLAHIYRSATLKEAVPEATLNKISWVKDKVFHTYYQINPDDRILVERLFNVCLVPYTLPPAERMKRLYLLYSKLDEPAVKAFHEMMKHRNIVRMHVKFILDGLDSMMANPKEHIPLLPRLQQLSKTLPDPPKSLEQLKKLQELLRDDKRLRSLVRYLVSAECTCRKANDNVKDILKKLGGQASASSPTQSPIYITTKSLLERVAPVMVDAQAIAHLVKHVEDAIRGHGTIADEIDNPGEKGATLLLCLSGVFPQFFKGTETFESLIQFLKEEEAVGDLTLQILTNCGTDLETQSPEVFAKLLPELQKNAKMGNPKQAKHAVRCINKIVNNREAVLSQVFEHVKNNLKPESANYITSIVALGHIANMCPEEFSQSMKTIVSKDIVKDLLMEDRTHGEPVIDSWYGDHHVTEETNAKLQAMKLLMRWLLGLKSNINNCCTSTLRLLYTVIVHEGDLMEKGLINKPELARLRLQAGCVILKLAEEPVFADLIQREQFQALALLINDSCYHVRVRFAEKLNKGLFAMKLPLEFMSIFSLAANDPVRERRMQIKKFIQQNIQRRRDFLRQNTKLGGKMFLYLPDYVMPYTIHLLAHDPDLKSYEDVQALKNIKECLWFIMEPLVARSEDYNYHFFRRLIENIKQAKDAQGPEEEDTNKKLYAVCDVALGLLQKNLTNIVLKDSNVDPVLPAKLFTKPDKMVLNSTVYLPKDFNFEKKKVQGESADVPAPVSPLVTGGMIFYRGRNQPKPTTLETIVVESPGPVVNPLPICPREPRPKKKQKQEETSQEDSSESEKASPKKRAVKSRGSKTAKGTAVSDEASESGDAGNTEGSETNSEPKSTPSPKKTGRGRRKKVVEVEQGDQGEEVAVQDSSENVEDSPEDIETSEAKDTSTQDSENSPPKKRLLKRTMAESKTAAKESKKAKRTDSDSPASIKSDNAKKKSVQKKGKGVVNGAGKGRGQGVKRAASAEEEGEGKEEIEEEGEENEEEETVSPSKKRKFNLEKDAVPAAKLTKKAAAKQKSSAASSPASTLSSPGKKSPGLTPSPGKKSPGFKSSPGLKSPGRGKNPRPAASATLTNKNVRRAKPLANGTSASDTDLSSPGKAAALSRVIQKANLGKNTRKTPTKDKKK